MIRTRCLRLALAVGAVFVASAAAAQEPEPSSPPQPAAPAAPPSPAARPPRSAELYFSTGYDFGFTKAVNIRFDDGSSHALHANRGSVLAVGATFLPAYDGALRTRATVGLKYEVVGGSGWNMLYLAVPVEVVEQLALGPVRLGAGASLPLGATYRGTGSFSGFHERLEPSLGLLLEASGVMAFRGGTYGTLAIGPRLLVQRLRWSSGGGAMSANALGLSLSFTL